ncbi:MAG: DUF3795 domain-containing protein [bacterium]
MEKLAYCGNDCNFCPRYIGTENNNTDELESSAEIWYKVGWRDRILTPDEMKCSGCSSAKECRYRIKECCAEKNIDNCGYCEEYACKKLKNTFKKTKEYKEKSKPILSKEDYKLLEKAFFLKKEN